MQRDEGNSFQKAFWKAVTPNEGLEFDDLWPTETRGDGKVRPNNFRTGAAQGKSSIKRKAPCRLCGFLNDLTLIDHSGGSIDGEGAGGNITTTTVSAPTSAPANQGKGYTHTEQVGTQAYRGASGCALCFSKNSTGMRVDVLTEVDPWDRLSLTGF